MSVVCEVREQKFAHNPELVQKTIADDKDNGDVPTRSTVLNEIKKSEGAKEIKKPHISLNSGNNEGIRLKIILKRRAQLWALST